MSQQALDLRRSAQIVRRQRKIVGIVAALGLLIAGGYAVLNPPKSTAKALVVLPNSASSIATQVVVASSGPVLQQAQAILGSGVSLQTLRDEIQIKSVTSYMISISASARTAAQAEAAANAVAKGYAGYVSSPLSVFPRVQASVLELATTATGGDALLQLFVTGMVGAFFGAVVGIIIVLARSRNDRRLRERDEIANSIGLPVLASLPVAHPSDAAGWIRLLDAYQPGVVLAWHLRVALQLLGVINADVSGMTGGSSSSLTVLSLSSDPGALALGPQVAVFVASLGIPTALVISPQQDAGATAMLRTACGATPSAAAKPRPHLQLALSDGGMELPSAALTVVVTVVDDKAPQLTPMAPTSITVLGVSAGAVTAEQLARVAAKVAPDGRGIAGIMVADPEPGDRTTGRIPSLTRPAARRRLPTRVTGVKTETRR
jgi:capsular polysaccharide biosynthesis protein